MGGPPDSDCSRRRLCCGPCRAATSHWGSCLNSLEAPATVWMSNTWYKYVWLRMERMAVMGKKSCVSKTTVRTEHQCGKNHEGKVQSWVVACPILFLGNKQAWGSQKIRQNHFWGLCFLSGSLDRFQKALPADPDSLENLHHYNFRLGPRSADRSPFSLSDTIFGISRASCLILEQFWVMLHNDKCL